MTVFFNGLEVVALATFAALTIFYMLVLYGRALFLLLKAKLTRTCYKHKPGKLLDVRGSGGRAKWKCEKCGEGYWDK